MVFHGSRLVFHGSLSVFMVFSWIQVGFSWFQVRFSWFFMVPGRFSWFFMVPGRFSWFFQLQLDLVFSVTEAYNTNSGLLMFDNLMLIQKVKGFSSKKMKGFFMSGAGLRFTWP